MSLRTNCRNYIVENVFRLNFASELWRALLINEKTATILAGLFKPSEILTYEFFLMEKINEESSNALPDNPALYFVYLDLSTAKIIEKNHKKKKYQSYTVISVNEPDASVLKRLESLESPVVVYKHCPLNFHCIAENVFLSDPKDIYMVSEILDVKFSTFCVDKDYIQNYKAVADKLKNFDGKNTGDCILYERVHDLFTPVLRFFSFEVILRDFGFVENDFVTAKKFDLQKSQIWPIIRDIHIAEVNNTLNTECVSLENTSGKIEKADAKQLISIVMEAPDSMQRKEEISMYLDLLSKCFDKFEKYKLNVLSILQQNIATGRTENKKAYSNSSSDCLEIFSKNEYTPEDKYKLWMLAVLSGTDFSDFESKDLIKRGIITKKDIEISKKISEKRLKNIRIKHPDSKYAISRYKPLLFHLVNSLEHPKKGLKLEQITKVSSDNVLSLRKTNFVFNVSNQEKPRKKIMVYINGGITYEELATARKLCKDTNTNIILGSDSLVTLQTFQEYLKK